MASTSATELLGYCLRGERWPDELLNRVADEALGSAEASREFFRIVVERLGDLFEPRLCDVYADLFSEVIAKVKPGGDLRARYERVRRPRQAGDAKRIFVLSRVTLGADVAVTSVVLDGVKQRYRDAEIYFVGPKKNYDLFAGDERIQHYPFVYGRSAGLLERIQSSPNLFGSGGIVVDPDSRLTQLGLLPVCDERDYYFFESRSYGGESDATLVALTKKWMAETFGTEARNYIAPAVGASAYDITVSLGVGENAEKLMPEPFEEDLLKLLRGRRVLVDKGAGGEETARVERAMHRAGVPFDVWDGDYAPFAAHIAKSGLYIGYDSAGQHVAAACGIPLVSIFAGFASERMLRRWYPDGPGPIRVYEVRDKNVPAAIDVIEKWLR